MSDALAPVQVEPVSFPVWVAVDAAHEHLGGTASTHSLTNAEIGESHLPIFLTEQMGNEYVAAFRGASLALSQIDGVSDLLIVLNLFKARGGNHVRFDPQVGRAGEILGGDIALDLDSFIAHVKSHLP
jgi:hypothetical protein